METSEDRAQQLKDDIERVNNWVITAADNGLFRKLQMNGNSITYDSIQDLLGKARTDYDSRRLSEGETNMAKAAGMYCNALYSTKWSWRFINVYGGFIWIYLTVFLLSAVFALYYFKVDSSLQNW